jgi:hypothetical protein
MLLAQPANTILPTDRGRFELVGVTVWQVRTASIVLSDGVQLRIGRNFANRLKRSDRLGSGLRRSLEGRQIATTVYVDRQNGEVLDVRFGGCA